jgi:hypothetical protein
LAGWNFFVALPFRLLCSMEGNRAGQMIYCRNLQEG